MPSGEPLDDAKYVDAAKDERVANNTVRHQYRVLSEAEKQTMLFIKDQGLNFIDTLDKMGSKREYSIAKTKIEEAVMWAVKGLTG